MEPCLASGAGASDGPGSAFAAGARIGTLGAGGELAVKAADWLTIRLLGHGGAFQYRDTFNKVDARVRTEFANAGVVAEVHAPDGYVRLSAGVFYNGNRWRGDATPQEPKRIGGVVFTPAEIGTIRGEAKTPEAAGYVGIGFGPPASSRARWAVSLDLGAWWFARRPSLTLASDGEAAELLPFVEALRREASDIEDRLIAWWPVLSIGVAYRF